MEQLHETRPKLFHQASIHQKESIPFWGGRFKFIDMLFKTAFMIVFQQTFLLSVFLLN